MFKSHSCTVNENQNTNSLKHHTSFTDEYDTFNKEYLAKCKVKEDIFSGFSQEKKIIGLKKCDSKDFPFYENPEFLEEKPENMEEKKEEEKENNEETAKK